MVDRRWWLFLFDWLEKVVGLGFVFVFGWALLLDLAFQAFCYLSCICFYMGTLGLQVLWGFVPLAVFSNFWLEFLSLINCYLCR